MKRKGNSPKGSAPKKSLKQRLAHCKRALLSVMCIFGVKTSNSVRDKFVAEYIGVGLSTHVHDVCEITLIFAMLLVCMHVCLLLNILAKFL